MSRNFFLASSRPGSRSNSTSRLRIRYIRAYALLLLSLAACDPNGNARNRFFEKALGFSLDDFAASVKPAQDGGYIITGRTNSARGNTDILVIRTDRSFGTVWSKTFGGPAHDQGWDAVELADGSMIVVGTIDTELNDEDLFVARVDAGSRLLWSRNFGGPGKDEGRAVMLRDDGTLMIVGTYDRSSFVTDLWVLHITALGDSLQSIMLDIRGSDRGRSIAPCPDGGFVAAAQVEGLDSVKFVHCLIRFDAQGNEMWRQTYSGINRDEPAQVIHTADGGFALVGSTNYKPIFRPPQIATTLIKTDAAGTLQWYHEYRLNPNDEGFSIVEVPGEGFLLTGTALTDFYASDNQLSLLRTDAQGNLLWVRYYGGPDTESGHSIIRIPNGYVVAGYTQSYGSGKSDVYCLKINNDGLLDD